MTYQDLQDFLSQGMGLQFAFGHWDRPPTMPYGVYFDDHTKNFAADDAVYLVVRHCIIELYVRQRDPKLERRMESMLDGAELFWDKDAVYIDSERFWKISYEIEV